MLEEPLIVEELDFKVLRGWRGAFIIVCDDVGSQYRVENGSMDFIL